MIEGKLGLFAPPEFWQLTPRQVRKLTNACGPQKAFWGLLAWLIPDDILGVDARMCCNIHDFMYGRGVTKKDKLLADRVLQLNLVIRVVDETKKFSETDISKIGIRIIMTVLYFLSVRFGGGVAFKKKGRV